MANVEHKFLKTLPFLFMAAVFAEYANAEPYHGDGYARSSQQAAKARFEKQGIPTRTTIEGKVIPDIEQDWFSKKTTYHEELRPKYDPQAQRVKQPVPRRFDGVNVETDSPTVIPSWLDRATTYHEEQRRPWNPYDSVTKNAPANLYYDSKEAERANKHYLRNDLKPVPYMYGSASLVMRSKQNENDYKLPDNMTLDGIVNPDNAPLRDSDYISEHANLEQKYAPRSGHKMFDDRYQQNMIQKNGNGGIMISDANSGKDVFDELYEEHQIEQGYTFHSNVMIGKPKTSQEKIATKISDPKVDWKSKTQTAPSNVSRPGDFDYKKTEEKTVEPYQVGKVDRGQEQGVVISSPENQEIGQSSDFYIITGDDGSEVVVDSNGNKVDNYRVVDGDTLSEISEKERIYGDWTLWPLIYDANRTQIQDPDLIYPGQNFDIPREYTTDQEMDAHHRARTKEVPVNFYDGK